MTTDTVSALRQRMIEDMNSRKLGPHTQRSHISSCKRLAAFLKRSLDTATREDIRRFQLHLAETGMSICNRNRIMICGPKDAGTYLVIKTAAGRRWRFQCRRSCWEFRTPFLTNFASSPKRSCDNHRACWRLLTYSMQISIRGSRSIGTSRGAVSFCISSRIIQP